MFKVCVSVQAKSSYRFSCLLFLLLLHCRLTGYILPVTLLNGKWANTCKLSVSTAGWPFFFFPGPMHRRVQRPYSPVGLLRGSRRTNKPDFLLPFLSLISIKLIKTTATLFQGWVCALPSWALLREASMRCLVPASGRVSCPFYTAAAPVAIETTRTQLFRFARN